jgi:CheY-like chemotaxis protein
MYDICRLFYFGDHSRDAETIRALLVQDGFACEFVQVNTGHAFQAALMSSAIDVILADYQMPKYASLATLVLAQKYCPEIPFIFLSHLPGGHGTYAALQQGASDCIPMSRIRFFPFVVRRAFRESVDRRARIAAERQLRSAERRLIQIFNTLPAPLLIATLKEGAILAVNDYMLHLHEFARERMVGRSLIEIGIFEGVNDFAVVTQRLIKSECSHVLEADVCIDSKLVFHMLFSISVIEFGGHACLLLVGGAERTEYGYDRYRVAPIRCEYLV